MIEFLKFVMSSFWIWAGLMLVIVIPIHQLYDFIYMLYDRKLSYRTIEKHGYPPAHCDAEGNVHRNNTDETE